MKALEMAWETRGKPGRVMFHSDRKNAGISFYHHSVWECGRFPRLSGDETCLLKKKKSAPLSFISNMVRSWLPSYVNWATLRKEICGVGSAHGKQVVAQKNPFVTSTVTPMSKNRLLLNIILTTTAAWRLPAEPWVIPALMCSLAGLMNVIPTDDVYLPVRPTRLRPLNQKSNIRLSWHSVHDK
ncbi:TPA: transposase, partial [Escherichia coli]|nr:transposase [Escherichia coli]